MTGAPLILFAEGAHAEPVAERLSEGRLHHCVLPTFETEAGERIANLRLAYRVFGEPAPDRSNIVLVLHALTGDTNCAGYTGSQGRIEGWWEPLFSKGGALPLDSTCVICANHPGGCYGSSGPTDTAVGGTAPLGPDFPVLTPRDLAAAQAALLEALGVPRLSLCIGGSLGGMVALELVLMFPRLAERAAVIAVGPTSGAQALAFNHVQRRCFELDPSFKDGRYHGGPPPALALSLARQMAMITYRSAAEFDERFGRALSFRATDRDRYFQVQHYLDHQGKKLLSRFDANSYLRLLDALDTHDVFRGRGDARAALAAMEARLLLVSVSTDFLYPRGDILAFRDLCREAGLDVAYEEIESPLGHDGFLLETAQLNRMLTEFLNARPGPRPANDDEEAT
jgi:homoserine O-acetyltransferase